MKVNIAILGLGTVGYGVYDIIKHVPYLKNVNIKKILDKDLSKNEEVGEIITTSFDEILNDDEIKVVIETMGAGAFSYKCIKESLLSGKNVITANKEVIAEHLEELTKIKIEKKVSLYYEASVGGGIPLIKPLSLVSLTNDINNICGILNGTTNYILTKMDRDDMSFNDALKDAQAKGFAEADPTNDLEGLDMVRKIAILSMISYKGAVNLKNIYHYGIKNVATSDIEYAKSKGYTLKYLATSSFDKGKAYIRIEPHFISNDDVITKTSDEFNIVEIDASINGKLVFFGKGAGRYPTANAIVNDLIMIMNKDKNYAVDFKEKIQTVKASLPAKYYIRVKNIKKIDQKIIEKMERNIIITKMINFEDINLDGVSFYAKIGK